MPSASADSKQDRSRVFARFVHRGSKCGSDGECQTSKLENTELPSRTRRTRACPTPPPNARPESHRQGNELHTRRVPSEGPPSSQTQHIESNQTNLGKLLQRDLLKQALARRRFSRGNGSSRCQDDRVCASSSPSFYSLRACKHTGASASAAQSATRAALPRSPPAPALLQEAHTVGPAAAAQPSARGHAAARLSRCSTVATGKDEPAARQQGAVAAPPPASNRPTREATRARPPGLPSEPGAPHSPPQPRSTTYAAPACDGTGSSRHAPPLRPARPPAGPRSALREGGPWPGVCVLPARSLLLRHLRAEGCVSGHTSK